MSFRGCLEAVKAGVDLAEYTRQWTELTPLGRTNGPWYEGQCPAPDHDDSTPSFYIYPGECEEVGHRWYCFGCARGGDVIDLAVLVEGYAELWAGMVGLAMRYGIELPQRSAKWKNAQQRKATLREIAARRQTERLKRWSFERFVLPAAEQIEDPQERDRQVMAEWRRWSADHGWKIVEATFG